MRQSEALACAPAGWADLMMYGFGNVSMLAFAVVTLFTAPAEKIEAFARASPLLLSLHLLVCVVAQCAATHGERTVWILGEQLYAWVLLPLV